MGTPQHIIIMNLIFMFIIYLIFFMSTFEYIHQHSRTVHQVTLSTLTIRAPDVPISGGATELPGTNLTLQYVALGLGTQKYFCPVLEVPPVQVGASATLLDVTTLAYDNQTALNSLPPLVVHSLLLPSRHRLNDPFPIVLGYHFFDSAGTPVFDLFSANKTLYGTKIAEIEAPETASKGPSGTGAVNWLLVGSKAGSKSSGCSLVYIVVTAGGRAPQHCAQMGTLVIHYAAEFWFFD